MSLADALARLPLFPLPDATLFPGALMPLHVFEPRYRQMIRDVLASHMALGVARILPGPAVDSEGHPPIARIIGAGTIVEHEALADGRYNILLRGEARVSLVELPFVSPYRAARAEILDDGDDLPGDAELSALRAVARELFRVIRSRAPRVSLELPDELPPERAAALLAPVLVASPDARQALLEERSARRRVSDLTTVLASQLRALSGRRAPQN